MIRGLQDKPTRWTRWAHSAAYAFTSMSEPVDGWNFGLGLKDILKIRKTFKLRTVVWCLKLGNGTMPLLSFIFWTGYPFVLAFQYKLSMLCSNFFACSFPIFPNFSFLMSQLDNSAPCLMTVSLLFLLPEPQHMVTGFPFSVALRLKEKTCAVAAASASFG